MALKSSFLTPFKDKRLTIKPGSDEISEPFQKWLDLLVQFINRRQQVINLTSFTADYKLKVGDCGMVNITAASTPLNVACEEGVYEIRVIFDRATFAADSDFGININNVTHVGAVLTGHLRADTSIATDQITYQDAARDKHLDFTNARWMHVTATITIMAGFSAANGIGFGRVSGQESLFTISTYWPGTHTSLGTIIIDEAATGVAYVRRTA